MTESPERPKEEPGSGRPDGDEEPELGEDVPHRAYSVDEEAAIEQRRQEDEEGESAG